MSSLATVNLLNTNSVKSGLTNVKKIKLGYMELWPENKQYIQHDWLQSTLSAYIDTNIIPKWEWRYECKIKITDSSHLTDYNTIVESLQLDGMVFGFYKRENKAMYLRFEDNTVTPRRGQMTYGTVSVGDTIVYLADPQNNYLKVTRTKSSGVTDSSDYTTSEPVISSGDIND
jgi:hypothetical protein